MVIDAARHIRTYDHRYHMCKKDRYPVVHGTPEFTARAKAVLAEAEKVELPAAWKPNFTTLISPQDYLEDLKKSLRAFVQGKYVSATAERMRTAFDYIKSKGELGVSYSEMGKVVSESWMAIQNLVGEGRVRQKTIEGKPRWYAPDGK